MRNRVVLVEGSVSFSVRSSARSSVRVRHDENEKEGMTLLQSKRRMGRHEENLHSL